MYFSAKAFRKQFFFVATGFLSVMGLMGCANNALDASQSEGVVVVDKSSKGPQKSPAPRYSPRLAIDKTLVSKVAVTAAAKAPATATVAAKEAPQAAAAVVVASGTNNADQPGFHTVMPGENLYRIGLDAGQSWKDIARWNALASPDKLEAGKVLRVAPPPEEVAAAAAGEAYSSNMETGKGKAPVMEMALPSPPSARQKSPTQLPAPSSAPVVAASPSNGTPKTAQAVPKVAITAPVLVTPSAGTGTGAGTGAGSGSGAAASAASPHAEVTWIWPAKGKLEARFEDAKGDKNKGVDIAGDMGDPVYAAATGKVVYAGDGLRGLGNLLIVKHGEAYFSVYAHNKALLVKEDKIVRRGQKIAEMGNSDSEGGRVKLHFEIRRFGKPVDPLKYLPVATP